MATKFTRFKNYETALRQKNGSTCNEQHYRLTRSMILSSAYIDLSETAIKIYGAMRIIARGEKSFEFSASIGLPFLGLKAGSEKSVRRAIKNLEKHGFIICTKFTTGANHEVKQYEFSDNWIKWRKGNDFSIK